MKGKQLAMTQAGIYLYQLTRIRQQKVRSLNKSRAKNLKVLICDYPLKKTMVILYNNIPFFEHIGTKLDLEKDESLMQTFSRVLNHLSGEEKIVPDKHGRVSFTKQYEQFCFVLFYFPNSFVNLNILFQIDIGNDIKVKQDAFEKNFEENKLNLIAATRNLVTLTWSKDQRLDRSLEGGVNNKFPDQPAKKMATPTKVMAVLGKLLY